MTSDPSSSCRPATRWMIADPWWTTNLRFRSGIRAQALQSRALITSAQLALAQAMLLNKDNAAALQTASEAQKIFGQSGQKDSEWRALLIAARASDFAGNKSAAQDYAARADKSCSELQQKWGDESYQSYLRRPDIQTYRGQLAQLLKSK